MTRIQRQDVLRYLKLHPSQLRAWEQKGLIPRRDSYSLEQYGCLRTLRDLSTRLSSASISASLCAMKSVSGIENPLLETRAMASRSRIHFWHRGQVTEPIARQFAFDFEPQRSTAAAGFPAGQANAESTPADQQHQLMELFSEAIRCEDASQSDQAIAVYERILERDPDHAPSCINLGTICYSRREFARAEQLYRLATQADPEYALAFFDLGNVLDELKRLPEAIAAYQAAIRLVPTYADAHYNLALACERTADRRAALRHWTAYLKLDSASRWAIHARKQVRKLLEREKLSIVHRSSRVAASRALPVSPIEIQVPTAG